MGCEQARKRKLGERDRWGWAGRKRVAGRSTGWVLVPASCPPSAPSIKPSTDISTICNAPAPQPAQVRTSADPSRLIQAWLPPSDGWLPTPTPAPPPASPQLGKHGQVVGVKPGAVRVTSSPRPTDPVFPVAAGDARHRETELRQEAEEIIPTI